MNSENCQTERAEYEIDGTKFAVMRCFTGDKDINKVVAELAVIRAEREAR